MPRRRATARPSLGHEGSGLLEALVALALVAALGSALSLGASGGIRSALAALTAIRASAAALRVDDSLRRAASLVAMPVWERAFSPDRDGSSLRLPYAAGERDAMVDISSSSGGMVIEAPGFRAEFPGVVLLGAEAFLGEGRAAGIAVEYRTGGRSYRTAARFGGVSLPAAEGE